MPLIFAFLILSGYTGISYFTDKDDQVVDTAGLETGIINIEVSMQMKEMVEAENKLIENFEIYDAPIEVDDE